MTLLHEVCEIQKQAAAAGFEWDHVDQIFDKIKEEALELQLELKGQNTSAIQEELGDLLFAAIGLSRFLQLDPESILEKALAKFKGRYSNMLRIAKSKKLNFEKLSSEEKETLWQESKKIALY